MSVRKFSAIISVSALALSAISLPAQAAGHAIKEAEVLGAQRAWCDALVNISTVYKKEGKEKAQELASKVIDSAYGYKQGVVLFKPTLASGEQTFRNDKEGALSYFAGGNPKYATDSGFALKGWTKCEIKNSGIHYVGNVAVTMGNVVFTNEKGVTTVDKTWAFKKDKKGKVRIVAHHSSLPYEKK